MLCNRGLVSASTSGQLTCKCPSLKKIAAVNERIDQANDRMAELEEEHRQDRITFPKLIEDRCHELLVEIRDMNSRMDLNIKQREEKEQKIFVKIQNQEDALMAMFQAEKALTEKKLMNLNKDITTEVHTRAKGYEQVKKSVFDHNEAYGARLDREEQERKRANEEVLQALTHYASALQDGVKIVGL